MQTAPLKVKSIEDAVYEAIREEILSRLRPGTPLRLATFAEQFGVSTMPVRGALMRLEVEGMVKQLPRKGAVVAALDFEDFEAIQALRTGIEGLASRVGAPKVTDEILQQAKAQLSAAEVSAEKHNVADYLRQANALHDTCYKASGRPQLVALVDEHRRPAERYTRRIVEIAPNLDDSLAYQRRFFRAMEDRDGDAAERAIREALNWSLEHVAAILEKDDTANSKKV